MRCVRPVLVACVRVDAFSSIVVIRCSIEGIKLSLRKIAALTCIAVGITSLLLWPKLTWSFGLITIFEDLDARVAMTSLAFMLELVPEPV